MGMDSRAIHDWQKRDVMEKVLKLWNESPHLRLGQLLMNAIRNDNNPNNLYGIEDYDLVDRLFAFNEEFNKNIAGKNKP